MQYLFFRSPTASLPFGYNVERSGMEALRLLCHCSWTTSTIDLHRSARSAMEISHSVVLYQCQLEASLAGLAAAMVEQQTTPTNTEDVWVRRWRQVLETETSNNFTPNPPSSPHGSPARTARLDPMATAASVNAEGSPFVALPLTADARLLRAITSLIVFVQSTALRHLRELIVLHNHMQYCSSYWRWGLTHPMRSCVHALLSRRRSSWEAFMRGRALDHAVHVAVTNVSELQNMEAYVVSSIGRVYNALDNLNRAIENIARAGSTDCSSSPSELVSALVSASSRALHGMTQRSYRPGGGSIDRGDDDARRPTSAQEFPRVQSVIIGEALSASSLDPSDHIQRLVMGLISLSQEQSRWVALWEDSLRLHIAPPAGRHWSRVAVTLSVVIPLTHTLTTMSWLDAKRFVATSRSAVEYVAHWYVVQPAKALYESLFHSRAGVEERRAKLQADVESIARIIKDYHKDYFDEPSHTELEEIRRNAILGDFGLISRHLEQAIRHPFRAFFFGNLVRLTLIQVQHLKLDVARVLASFDEVLETNDVNFRMMALGPLVIMGVALVSYLALRKKKKLRPAYTKMRVLWRSLHRLITFARTDEELDDDDDHEEEEEEDRGCRRLRGGLTRRPLITSSAGSFLDDEEQGRVVLMVHTMRSLREYLYDYPLIDAFLEDLDDLEASHSTRHQRLRTLGRMMSVHFFLAPRDDL